MEKNLSLGLDKFLWTKKELCTIEKADQAGGYKWQRKDGTWWTNHQGQIVPYHEPTHGAKSHNADVENFDDLNVAMGYWQKRRGAIDSALHDIHERISNNRDNEDVNSLVRSQEALYDERRGSNRNILDLSNTYRTLANRLREQGMSQRDVENHEYHGNKHGNKSEDYEDQEDRRDNPDEDNYRPSEDDLRTQRQERAASGRL